MTTPTTVNVRLQLRADTAANWAAANPTLLANEVGLETDTKKLKVGSGSTAWNSLAYFPSIVTGGTVLGNLEIGSTGTLTFEGSTADGFETTLAVTNPTADRTITLPNQSGTVVVSGNASIIDADISASAEIAVSKLADGAARQLLQTDAAGTGVEWTSNVDVPGTLDVTGAATFDAAVTIAGDLTVNGTTTNINTQNLVVEDKNIILADVTTPTDTTADGGGITLKGATDKTITWSDTTDSWEFNQPTITTGSSTAASFIPTSSTVPSNGVYLSGTNTVAVATNSTGRLFVDASGNVNIGAASFVAGDNGLSLTPLGFNSYRNGTNERTHWSLYNNNGLVGRVSSTTSGMDIHSTDRLVFITASSERLRITSDGKLGLGTSSPSEVLDVRQPVTTGTYQARIAVQNTDQRTIIGSYWRSGVGQYSIIQATNAAESASQVLSLNPSGGNVGIGTTAPGTILQCYGGASGTDTRITVGNAATSLQLGTDGSNNALISTNSANSLAFYTNNSEKARIDSSGRLLVGTSSALTNYQWFGTTYIAPSLQVANENVGQASLGLFCNNAVNTSASQLMLAKAASGTAGLVDSGETLGVVVFNGADGTNLIRAASIEAAVDGTPSANDMPGRLVFSTTADGASSPTERVRITSSGAFKASNAGTYVDATAKYHELYGGESAVSTLVTYASNASFAHRIVDFSAARAANSSYQFLLCNSGAYASTDTEFNLRGDGNGYCDGAWTGGGADYAEYFEWSDSNPDAEDRRGISVVLDGDKIRPAISGEDPIGVISGNPSVVGDAAWNKWSGKYLRDEFGTYILEDYEVTDDDGNTVTQQRRKLNPAYDPDVEYTSREERPEWDCVGLMGKLRLRKGQPTGSRWIKMRDISDSVEEWLVR